MKAQGENSIMYDKLANLSKINAYLEMQVYCAQQIEKLTEDNRLIDEKENSHVENKA